MTAHDPTDPLDLAGLTAADAAAAGSPGAQPIPSLDDQVDDGQLAVDDDELDRADAARETARVARNHGHELPGRLSRVHLSDGDSFVVRISNREFVAWDQVRGRQKWPAMQDAPFLAASWMSWRAALREGHAAGRLTWEQWADRVEYLENLGDVVTRPTRSGRGPGSS